MMVALVIMSVYVCVFVQLGKEMGAVKKGALIFIN